MKTLVLTLFWFVALPSMTAQSTQAFDVSGILTLTQRPLDATPVEALEFRIHPLAGGFDIPAQPDTQGHFVLRNVLPGPYSLIFPMPGRFYVFAIGAAEVDPANFVLSSANHAALTMVVSMKSTTISVRVPALSNGQTNDVALLVPDDKHLTLRESCYSSKLTGAETLFPFVPIGRYRILIFNEKYLRDVSGYAPRVLEFLRNESMMIDAGSASVATVDASPIADDTVEAAILSAGGHFASLQ